MEQLATERLTIALIHTLTLTLTPTLTLNLTPTLTLALTLTPARRPARRPPPPTRPQATAARCACCSAARASSDEVEGGGNPADRCCPVPVLFVWSSGGLVEAARVGPAEASSTRAWACAAAAAEAAVVDCRVSTTYRVSG